MNVLQTINLCLCVILKDNYKTGICENGMFRTRRVRLKELEFRPLSEHPVCSGVPVARSLVFCVVFCRSLLVLLSFFIWLLYCLSLDLWLLKTTFFLYIFCVFSNSAAFKWYVAQQYRPLKTMIYRFFKRYRRLDWYLLDALYNNYTLL
jgi:hypothetical protein